MKRVVITGMGALTPIGNSVEEFWGNLIEGKSGSAPITYFDTTEYKTKFACELKDFSVKDHLDKQTIRRTDPYTQYALIAAKEALEQAGVSTENIPAESMGVIWGSGQGGLYTIEEELREIVRNGEHPRFSPYFLPKMLANMASGVLSLHFGLKGMSYTTISACATSNTAIMDAFNYIRWGKLPVILTGGSEFGITTGSVGGFNALRGLSTRNDDPATASRPFDGTRDGFVLSEGAGALVFEDYDHAVARGATIYAEVVGAAMTSDAYHLTASHPEGEGSSRAMNLALEDAGIPASEISYVNMHATSTPLGDASEVHGLNTVFGKSSENLHASAIKSMIGHMLGAAGAVEAIACVQALRHGIVPPTINTTEVDPNIPTDIDLTLGKAVSKEVNFTMNNNFGFGGHNSISIFKRWT
ncbi:MAG: beta-ketoacyl-ACP synthase II [Bacteroidota bacterium]